MPDKGLWLPRPPVRWALALLLTGPLTLVSAPGDGLPPLALTAGWWWLLPDCCRRGCRLRGTGGFATMARRIGSSIPTVEQWFVGARGGSGGARRGGTVGRGAHPADPLAAGSVRVRMCHRGGEAVGATALATVLPAEAARRPSGGSRCVSASPAGAGMLDVTDRHVPAARDADWRRSLDRADRRGSPCWPRTRHPGWCRAPCLCVATPAAAVVRTRFGLRAVSAVATVVGAVLIGGELRSGWAAASQARNGRRTFDRGCDCRRDPADHAVALLEGKRRAGEARQASQDFVRARCSTTARPGLGDTLRRGR